MSSRAHSQLKLILLRHGFSVESNSRRKISLHRSAPCCPLTRVPNGISKWLNLSNEKMQFINLEISSMVTCLQTLILSTNFSTTGVRSKNCSRSDDLMSNGIMSKLSSVTFLKTKGEANAERDMGT